VVELKFNSSNLTENNLVEKKVPEGFSLQKAALKKAAGVSGGKDQCQVWLQGRERDYWMGTEIGMLGGYGFQGQVPAGDGSDKQGKMGAGCNNWKGKKKKQQCKGLQLKIGLQLKRCQSAWIGSVFSGASWHADRGAVAIFVCHPVIVEGSQ